MEASPRVAAFVRSQSANLSFYRTQGEALLSSYLSAQRPPAHAPPALATDAAAAGGADLSTASTSASPPPFELPSSPPATPNDVHCGASGVEVLNAARQRQQQQQQAAVARPSSSSARHVPLVANPTRPGTRLVDRMKGREGGPGSAAGRGRTKPSAPTAKLPGARQASGGSADGSSAVLTRRELRGEPQPSTGIENTSPGKRARAEVDDEDDDDMIEMERPPPTPPRTARKPRHPRPSQRRSGGHPVSGQAPPTPLSPANVDVRAELRAIRKRPAAAVGLDGLDENWKEEPARADDDDDDDAGRHVVRLENRRARRRAKAAIVKPKVVPTSADADSAASARSDDPSPARARKIGAGRQAHIKAAAPGKGTVGRMKGKTRRVADHAGSAENDDGPRGKRRLGLGPLDSFRATNIVDGRLTLRRSDGARPGVFNKGVASSKVVPQNGRVRGVPDLVFSEATFLGRPRPPPREHQLKALSSASSTSSRSAGEPSPTKKASIAARANAAAPGDEDERSAAPGKKQKTTVATLATGARPSVSRFFNADRAARAASEPAAGSDTTDAASEAAPAVVAGKEAQHEPAPAWYSPSWPDSAAASQLSQPHEAHRSAEAVVMPSRQSSAASTRASGPPHDEPLSPARPQHAQPVNAYSTEDRGPDSLLYLPPTLVLPPQLASADPVFRPMARAARVSDLDDDSSGRSSVADPLLLAPHDESLFRSDAGYGVMQMDGMSAAQTDIFFGAPFAGTDVDLGGVEQEHGSPDPRPIPADTHWLPAPAPEARPRTDDWLAPDDEAALGPLGTNYKSGAGLTTSTSFARLSPLLDGHNAGAFVDDGGSALSDEDDELELFGQDDAADAGSLAAALAGHWHPHRT